MNSQNAFGANSNSSAEAARDAEVTLRLIANLPAPDGLEDRVIAGLRKAPSSGGILTWPHSLRPTENWFRAAAAAAVVFVVVGGGWGIYSRVQPSGATAVSPHPGNASGFSNAGAVRVPQTLPAPIVAQPAPVQPAPVEPAKKVRGKATSRVHHGAKADAVNKAAAKPSVSVAR